MPFVTTIFVSKTLNWKNWKNRKHWNRNQDDNQYCKQSIHDADKRTYMLNILPTCNSKYIFFRKYAHIRNWYITIAMNETLRGEGDNSVK